MNNKENSYHGLAIIQGYEQYLNEECENMSEEEREKWKVKLREYRNQMYKIQDRPITLTFADCFEMVDDYRDYLAAKSPMTEIEKPVIGNLISKEEHDAAIEKMQTEINEAQNAADVIQKKYDNLLIKYSSDTKTLEEKLKETEKGYEEAYNAYLLNQHILDEIQGNNEQEVHYKNRSQKITSSALFQLIVRARGDNNPVELMNTDASKMISYFTQYSPESIRQDLSCNVLNKRNREEAEKVTAEMKRLGINITIE